MRTFLQEYWQEKSRKELDAMEAKIDGEEWKSKKGLYPKRWICDFVGCKEEVLAKTYHEFEYGKPQPPEPKEGVEYIEQKYTLYHISRQLIRILRCKRCREEWYDVQEERNEPPLKCIKWIRRETKEMNENDK